MGLTISSIESHSLGDLLGTSAVVTFDSSYVTGGETLLPTDVALGAFVGPVEIIAGEDGYVFKWDRANEKILVYESSLEVGSINTPAFTGDAQTVTTQVPFFVEEETQSASSDVITLDYAPAYIVSIAHSTGLAYRTIPSAAAPVDNASCAVNFAAGTLTFHANDDPTNVRITYFPSRPGTFFDNANAVEETLTAAETAVDFTNRAAIVQHVYNNNTPGLEKIIPVGETEAAAEIILNINDSGDTSISSNAAEVGDIIAVRYLNFSALTPGITFVDDTDVSFTSEDINFASAGLGQGGTATRDKLIVPGFGNVLVGEDSGGTNNQNAVWGDSGTTEADGFSRWASKINLWASNNTQAFVTAATPQLEIDFTQLTPPQPVPSLVTGTIGALTFTGTGSSPLTEVANATNLSAVVVDIFARGR